MRQELKNATEERVEYPFLKRENQKRIISSNLIFVNHIYTLKNDQISSFSKLVEKYNSSFYVHVLRENVYIMLNVGVHHPSLIFIV